MNLQPVFIEIIEQTNSFLVHLLTLSSLSTHSVGSLDSSYYSCRPAVSRPGNIHKGHIAIGKRGEEVNTVTLGLTNLLTLTLSSRLRPSLLSWSTL